MTNNSRKYYNITRKQEVRIDKFWNMLTVGSMIEWEDYYGRTHLSIITNTDINPKAPIRIEMYQVKDGKYRDELLADLEYLYEKGNLRFVHENKDKND